MCPLAPALPVRSVTCRPYTWGPTLRATAPTPWGVPAPPVIHVWISILWDSYGPSHNAFFAREALIPLRGIANCLLYQCYNLILYSGSFNSFARGILELQTCNCRTGKMLRQVYIVSARQTFDQQLLLEYMGDLIQTTIIRKYTWNISRDINFMSHKPCTSEVITGQGLVLTKANALCN